MAKMPLLTLLIIQAWDKFASVQGNLLLIRSGPGFYVAISKVAAFVLRGLGYAHALDVNCADQVPLEAEPALAVAVIQARHAITSLVGSGRNETRRILIVKYVILCAVAGLGQRGAHQRCGKG